VHGAPAECSDCHVESESKLGTSDGLKDVQVGGEGAPMDNEVNNDDDNCEECQRALSEECSVSCCEADPIPCDVPGCSGLEWDEAAVDELVCRP